MTYGATGHNDCPDEAAGADLLLPVTITSVSPNPFVGSTRISLSLTRPGPVRVEVLDAAGRRAALVADLACEPGVHSFNWNASETRSGIYFLRVTADGAVRSEKLIVLR